MEVKVIDMLKEGMLIPPEKGNCQECGRKHPDDYPHDLQSLYYQMKFKKDNDRWPTWDDAMSHCTEDMKKVWKEAVDEVTSKSKKV